MRRAWPHVQLREVLKLDLHRIEVDSTETYQMVGVYSFGRGLFDREPVHGGSTSYKHYYRLNAKHIVMSQLFGWEGALALSSDNFAGKFVSPQFPTFAVDEDRVDRYFLGWCMRRKPFWEELGARTRGLGDRRRTLNPDALFACEIAVPPLEEQRRIVAKIERLAAKIDEARGLRAQLSSEIHLLGAAGCRQIFSEGRWPRRSVDQLIGRARLSNGKSVKSAQSLDGIRCLRLSAMRNGRLDLSDTKSVPLTASEAAPYLIAPGNVFVLRGNGSKDLVGRAALVSENENGIIFPDLFIRVPLEDTNLDPKFFVAFWNSPLVRELVKERATTTAGIWKINQGHIASVQVPLAAPSEQRRIVAYLDGLQAKVDQLKALQAQTRAELDALLPAILDRAFKGEL